VARQQVCADIDSVVKNVDVSRNQSGVLGIAWAVVRRSASRGLVGLTRLRLRLRMGLAVSRHLKISFVALPRYEINLVHRRAFDYCRFRQVIEFQGGGHIGGVT
jgi:hypothetical protein